MHIAHFTNAYLPLISGVVRSVSMFREALTELGHVVFVFAQDSENYQDEEPFVFRYPTIDLPLSTEIPLALPISPFIDQLLPALKLDVIHTHHPVLLGQAAASKAEELNLPLVFTFHTQYREYSHYFPISQERVQEFIRNRIDSILKEYMQKCQHIVVPTHSMAERLKSSYGLDGEYTIIPTGIDLRPYRKADGREVRKRLGWENDKIMISIGRLSHEKNWKTLLKAGAIAMREVPGLRMALIGEGPERDNLEDLAAELGVAQRVDFLGEVCFAEIPDYLKAADLFGFSSINETQGLVTLEAMAAGLPVVAVDATGTRDVVESGVQGILTSNQPHELAQAICSLLADEARILVYKAAALQKAAAFGRLEQARKLERVYEQAIEDKRANRYVMLSENLRPIENVLKRS